MGFELTGRNAREENLWRWSLERGGGERDRRKSLKGSFFVFVKIDVEERWRRKISYTKMEAI